MISPESMSALRFRHMRLEDVEQVYAIDVLSFSLPWSERSYRFEVGENENSRVWVAEAVDAQGYSQIVGMTVIWLILDEAHVANIAVHPDFRHLGIGRKLLARGLLDAVAGGATQSFLEVRRGNLNAQTLYQEFGYEVVGVRVGYYSDNREDALLMTLDPIRVDFLREIAPQAGMPGDTPQAEMPGATPQAGMPGATPQTGVPGATPQTGVRGATPQTGVRGATPQTGVRGATPPE